MNATPHGSTLVNGVLAPQPRQVASEKTCPHHSQYRLTLSGTKVRELLRNGANRPEEFTRPRVAEVLRAAYRVAET